MDTVVKPRYDDFERGP
ncbi:MAG: hypothetical protein KAS93_04395 [Gammaproteobacteria bacterium]|nr:hypothetical protein [Gammaproteobacteria bacterium]